MARFTGVYLVPKHDTNESVFDAFMVETDGEIHVETFSGQDVTLPVVAGTIYPIAVRKVFATGTTVGEVYGLV